ncbi:4'-phosphopantetheinyl transferase superfamily protein [Streptomyces sp. 549]|uniref:4'-phosphopantetheinyl transferase family protein n=1 Tax=Streptomyces sp. 549 TaxID=3049076 RepID=UPI0024C345F9|nr:4'-phosphopantetheinyl transferase superfamily protein [Streptomyces sp. 549]MDK1475820.1 4'-phosphopantetheinyl transferase superfamily protein [Streptomyces sp. 549]
MPDPGVRPELTVVPAGIGSWDLAPPDSARRPRLYLLRVSEHRVVTEGPPEGLDEQERGRWSAYVRQEDRDRYAVAHLALRGLLGSGLGVPPADVDLTREDCPMCGGPHGRPAVRGGGVHFSLSHSGDLVLLGFAPVPVGVDVETVPTAAVAREVASSLHRREREEIAGLPAPERPAAFARCWVRKEAYLKGTGEGLAGGLESTYLGTGAVPPSLPGWNLADVDTDPGYLAAVAVAVP